MVRYSMKIECPECNNKKSPSQFRGRAICQVCWIRYKKSDAYPKPLDAIESVIIPVESVLISVEEEKVQFENDLLRNKALAGKDKPLRERARRLERTYNISLDDYDSMYQHQDGRCLICGESFPLLHVDHDHATGRVRGLLCRACNCGLGHFKDDTDRLQKAIEYLGSKLVLS